MRTCGRCGEEGHNSRTCDKKNSEPVKPIVRKKLEPIEETEPKPVPVEISEWEDGEEDGMAYLDKYKVSLLTKVMFTPSGIKSEEHNSRYVGEGLDHGRFSVYDSKGELLHNFMTVKKILHMQFLDIENINIMYRYDKAKRPDGYTIVRTG